MSINDATPSELDERREFFRIDDQVVLEFREITATELPAMMLRFTDTVPDRFSTAASFAATSRSMHRAFQEIQAQVPEVKYCLDMLDHKLNRLAQMFMQEDMRTPLTALTDVNLSGGGVRFNAQKAIKRDTLLEVKLVLVPDYIGILALGRVAYCEPVVGSMGYLLGVEFDMLRENDRDLLVKHLFTRQTTLLRAQRGASE